jgi:hypothetical protein
MAGSHGGRPKSWLAVAITVIGFTIGGVALTIGPNWIVFWVGAAIVLVGGLVGMAVGIFSDVVLDEPRVIPEIADISLFGGQSDKRRGGPYGETVDKPTKSDTQSPPHG